MTSRSAHSDMAVDIRIQTLQHCFHAYRRTGDVKYLRKAQEKLNELGALCQDEVRQHEHTEISLAEFRFMMGDNAA